MVALRALRHPASDIFEIVSRSVEETEQLGERLGKCLSAGDVVGLVGELGSGKTTLIRGLAKGLGIEPDQVRSPTFVLLREYPSKIPLVHIDGYRLDSTQSVVWLDVDWLFSPKKITVIEWADRFSACLPEDYLEICLAHKTTNQRSIRLVGHGPRSQQLVDALKENLHGQAAGSRPQALGA